MMMIKRSVLLCVWNSTYQTSKSGREELRPSILRLRSGHTPSATRPMKRGRRLGWFLLSIRLRNDVYEFLEPIDLGRSRLGFPAARRASVLWGREAVEVQQLLHKCELPRGDSPKNGLDVGGQLRMSALWLILRIRGEVLVVGLVEPIEKATLAERMAAVR